jgi:hypothetical protein
MPDESPRTLEKIFGCFTKRGIIISLIFIWTIWVITMLHRHLVLHDASVSMLIGTFILLTVYAILISPITEWSWNLMTGGKS